MKHILITGASSGIGAAVAKRLATPDSRISLGARRTERLDDLVEGAFCHRLDVTDEESVQEFIDRAVDTNGPVDVLINNAGLARGLELIAEADGIAWREMIETNIFGVLHMTKRILPSMIERGQGHIVMLGSIAGHETYHGGSVYCASKRGLISITEGLRIETRGTGIRVTSVDPGMVETEFSLVRFKGDTERAGAVYTGTRPLHGEDIADCIEFALSRPAHVCIDNMLVMPTDQVRTRHVYRSE